MKKIVITTHCKKKLADIFTPVGIYLRLRDRFRDTILLESADFHTAENSWSFIAVQAIAGFEVMDNHTIDYKFPGQPPVKKSISKPAEVVPELNNYLSKFSCEGECDIKAAQNFFGYTSYDAVQFFDSIKLTANGAAASFPLLRYRLYQYVIAINHFKDELFLCENKI
ncbi:MAG TPA: hypothetical protein VLR49_08730, partial [Ferruginibacter sp.]|nr:hypothetical protein [Ferruginibacter sp.]